ncbi:MAG: hypothetical protein GXO48_03110 [Chlorobi bacterium]|nr:hypothetical protein [Chlorobiota bacterium]
MLSFHLAVAQLQWIRSNPGGGGVFNTGKILPNGSVWIASDLSGAYVSYDNGKSWVIRGASHGLTETHISAIGFIPGDSNIVLIGTESGIFKSKDGGETFYSIHRGGYITDIAFSQTDESTGYASSQQNFNLPNATILKTTDGGDTWVSVGNLPDSLWILKIVVHPLSADTVFVLTGMGRWTCKAAKVFRSEDGGISWHDITATLGSEIMDIAFSPDSPYLFYLTTMNADCQSPFYWTDLAGNLFVSNNNGNSWNQINSITGLVFPSFNDTIRIIDPREPFLWNANAGTFLSTNGGYTFTKISSPSHWDVFFNQRSLLVLWNHLSRHCPHYHI